MTPLQQAAAIKAALGLPEQVTGALPIAMAAAAVMGMTFEENAVLPQMLALLVDAIGIDTSTAAPAVTPALAATVAADAAQTPVRSTSTADGKKRQRTQSSGASSSGSSFPSRPPSSFPPQPSAQHQPTLFRAAGSAARLLMRKREREVYAAQQAEGEAVSLEQMQQDVALEVVRFPSEIRPPPPPPKPVFNCVTCGKSFGRAVDLTSHRLWKHPTQPRDRIAMPVRTFRGSLSAPLSVGADGVVSVTILVNGKSREQLVSEAEADERALDAAKLEREVESARRVRREMLLREAEKELGEQRRGSAHRATYTFNEKVPPSPLTPSPPWPSSFPLPPLGPECVVRRCPCGQSIHSFPLPPSPSPRPCPYRRGCSTCSIISTKMGPS